VGSPIYGWISDRIHRRKTLMVFGGVISIITFACILLLRFPSEGMLTFLFFSLGFFTSSQTLGYPAITEHNPKELTGTSMGIAALIIMGIPALIQPLSGKLLDMSWDGTMSNGAPLYSASDFQTAFLIFPIGFLISLFALLKIKESPKKELALAI